jgi:hypothetical protein
MQGGHQTCVRPLVQAASNRPVRAPGFGQPLGAGAVHQRRDDLIKHDPIGDPGTVTAQRMGGIDRGAVGEQDGELGSERLDHGYWHHGNENLQHDVGSAPLSLLEPCLSVG